MCRLPAAGRPLCSYHRRQCSHALSPSPIRQTPAARRSTSQLTSARHRPSNATTIHWALLSLRRCAGRDHVAAAQAAAMQMSYKGSRATWPPSPIHWRRRMRTRCSRAPSSPATWVGGVASAQRHSGCGRVARLSRYCLGRAAASRRRVTAPTAGAAVACIQTFTDGAVAINIGAPAVLAGLAGSTGVWLFGRVWRIGGGALGAVVVCLFNKTMCSLQARSWPTVLQSVPVPGMAQHTRAPAVRYQHAVGAGHISNPASQLKLSVRYAFAFVCLLCLSIAHSCVALCLCDGVQPERHSDHHTASVYHDQGRRQQRTDHTAPTAQRHSLCHCD